MYRLHRTLPDGTRRSHFTAFATRSDAAVAASYVLSDNTGLPRPDARAFATQLAAAPVGTTVPHEGTGYSFRIATADA